MIHSRRQVYSSRLNKEEHQLENSVVNVGAVAKLKLSAATFCLRRKGSYEAIARQLFWIVSSNLQKSAHWFTNWFVVCLALICSIWFTTMQNPLNFSKRLPIMFLLRIKSKQLFHTSQNHKWMSFWRWLDLIRRRSLRTLIFAKIVWMYFFGDHLSKYHEELWEVFKVVCTLSHGQSLTERVFSVIKEVIDHNMKEKSITSQCTVYDGIKQH